MINMNALNPEELAIAKWQYGYLSGFERHLFSAISIADKENLANLEKGFPVEVSGYRKYTSQAGWWEGVQKKANTW